MSTADHTLLDRWIEQRDAQAFKSLSTKYGAMVYATCLRILRNAADAEDVAQESFAALATATRAPQATLGVWLHRIATYQALSHRRADGRRRERETRFAQSRAAVTEAQWDDISPFVDQSIEALPEKLRNTIIAHFFNDESVTEIAAREGVTHSAISQRIQRGVTMVRERMVQNGFPIGAAALATMLSVNASASVAVPLSLTHGLARLALTGGPSVAAEPVALFVGTKVIASAAAALAVVTAVVGYAVFHQPESVTAAEAVSPSPPIQLAAAIDAPTQEALVDAPVPVAPETTPIEERPAAKPTALPPATWQEIVAAYSKHQDRIRHIQFDFQHSKKGTYYHPSHAAKPGYREQFNRGTVTTDGERCYIEDYCWGDRFGGEIMAADKPDLNACAWDGYTYTQYCRGGGSWYGIPGSIQYHPDAQHSRINVSAFKNGRTYLLFARYPDGAMLGYPLRGTGLRFEEILASANEIRLRPETDDVNGSPCYVVDANTPYCTISVWFDPAHDYNVAQYMTAQMAGHLYYGTRLQGVNSFYFDYVTDAYVNVDGLWVPSESTCRERDVAADGQGYDYINRHKRMAIKPLADADGEDAYMLHAEYIINGTELNLPHGVAGKAQWVWYNGDFVPKDPNAPREKGPQIGGGFGAGAIIAGSAG